VLGPVLVTSDELSDPYSLDVRCVIEREEQIVFDESVGTDRIKRRFDELTEYLMLNNPIPVGTVVSTGTGVIVPPELGLHAGDNVEITITGIGTLRHTMAKLPRDWTA
jgi:2-dehydro-3-deoxy-D-arabinonate dehydratase